jgi:hypothetical protein
MRPSEPRATPPTDLSRSSGSRDVMGSRPATSVRIRWTPTMRSVRDSVAPRSTVPSPEAASADPRDAPHHGYQAGGCAQRAVASRGAHAWPWPSRTLLGTSLGRLVGRFARLEQRSRWQSRRRAVPPRPSSHPLTIRLCESKHQWSTGPVIRQLLNTRPASASIRKSSKPSVPGVRMIACTVVGSPALG